jgi:hypothetical protein
MHIAAHDGGGDKIGDLLFDGLALARGFPPVAAEFPCWMFLLTGIFLV